MSQDRLQIRAFSSRKLRRLAEQAMVRGLTPRQAHQMDRLLSAGSDDDRQAYTELAGLFSALEGTGEALTGGQSQRVLAGIKQQVCPQPPGRRWFGGLTLAPWLVAAAVVLVLALIPALLLRPDQSSQPELMSRGVGQLGPDPRQLTDLRIYCIRDGVPKKQQGRLGARSPDARCLPDDQLQLMLTHTADYPYLLVIGHHQGASGEHRRLWYFPVPPTGRSGLAPTGVEYGTLGQAINLGVNHRPGRTRVVAVFSRAPLDADQVYGWLKTLRQTDSAEALLDRLGGGDLTAVEEQLEISTPQAPRGIKP